MGKRRRRLSHGAPFAMRPLWGAWLARPRGARPRARKSRSPLGMPGGWSTLAPSGLAPKGPGRSGCSTAAG
eukprot:2221427-Alexandrium_andersonii.AAC.1